MNDEKNIISSVEKAIRLITELNREPRQTPAELGKKLDITRTAAYRLIWTLERHRVVVSNDKSEYSLGPYFLNLNFSKSFEQGIIDLSLPMMIRLRNATKETVGIFLARSTEVVAGEFLESPYEVRRVTRPGDSLPLTKGATGVCYLAWRITEVRNPEEFLVSIGIDVTDHEHWNQRLSQIREAGYCASWGERVPGSASIAAAIKDGTGNVRAIVTVSGPNSRITPEGEKTIAELVIQAAHEIEQLLKVSMI